MMRLTNYIFKFLFVCAEDEQEKRCKAKITMKWKDLCIISVLQLIFKNARGRAVGGTEKIESEMVEMMNIGKEIFPLKYAPM